MQIKNVFQIIDSKADEIKNFWIETVKRESYSYDKEDVDKLGDFISDFAEKHGFLIDKHYFKNSGNGLILAINSGCQLPSVSLMGHMDTVHKKGTFKELIREDNKYLYGPGIYDCKGGIAVAILVMCALKESGFEEKEVKLILSPDEEISNALSGQEGIDFIRKGVRGSIMALNCDSGSLDDQIVVGRKGVARFQVDIKGKAAHSGSSYDDGISAIKEAAHKIIHIEEPSDSKNITYNCGIINGGSSPNAIPECCSFIIDVRYNSIEDKQIALKHMESIVNTSYIQGTTAKLTLINDRIPMLQTEENMKLFHYLKSVSAKYELGKLTPCFGGGSSDSSYSVVEGVPSLCAMGIAGINQHTLNEKAEIASLARRAKMITAVIIEYN